MPPIPVILVALGLVLVRVVAAVRDGSVPFAVGLLCGSGFLYLGVRLVLAARYW